MASRPRSRARSPPQVEALAELQQQGLVRHIGISTVSAEQVAEAQTIAPIVCVQNFYNIAHREDDDLIDSLAEQGIAYVPYFPLGGFTPLQSDGARAVAARLDATPMAVALAWLLQRSPNILLIPGTSSRRAPAGERRRRRARAARRRRRRAGRHRSLSYDAASSPSAVR